MNNTFCKNCHRIPSQCVCQPTKPVAYVNSMCSDYIDWKVDPMSIDGQSLYTHPVKELTDEEKKEIAKQYLHSHLLYVVTEEVVDDFQLANVVVTEFDFRKAQEK